MVRFGTGALEELGRAGSPRRLYGLPARRIVDVTVQYAPRPPGQGPTPAPTPDPIVGPPPPPRRTIWVADGGAHVVAGITIEANLALHPPVILGEYMTPGDDAGHFNSPGGVAADAYGNLYVSDTGNHRVLVFGEDLSIVATIGASGRPGTGNDQLSSPGRLATDDEGRLFIADTGNARVQGFDITDPAAPRWVASYGTAGGPQGLRDPVGVGTDATFVYVADGSGGRVQIYEKNDGDYWKTLDGRSAAGCGSTSPDDWWTVASDVAITQDGTINVALPRRMQVATCDAFTREPRDSLGSRGAPYVPAPGTYNAPAAAAEAADGFVVIAEAEGHRVVGRNPDGSEAWTFGAPGVAGNDQEHLDGPSDVAFYGGQAVVADRGNGRLVFLDRLGRRTAGWGKGVLAAPAGDDHRWQHVPHTVVR
ncbi:MAG: NHL repeat-containing protein, partial [Anaerolineae bacterium]